MLSFIHEMVIEEICTKFGALFSGVNYSRKQQMLRHNVNEILYILQKYRQKINDNRTKQLINHLILYFKSQGDIEDISITTEDFHIIWELMVNDVWRHDATMANFVSQAKWDVIFVDKKIQSQNRQIPDTLIRDDDSNEVHILDAKYYDLTPLIEGSKNVPLDWYSVVKQFFYNFSFDYSRSTYMIGHNCFVFPEYRNNYRSSGELLTYIGKVTIELPIGRDKKIETLGVVTVPVFSLMSAWMAHNSYRLTFNDYSKFV